MRQMTLDESSNALTDPKDWSFATKTPTAIAYARCAWCGARPVSLHPLPSGWSWDTMEPANPWLICPCFKAGEEHG